jgi:hypothetical protein
MEMLRSKPTNLALTSRSRKWEQKEMLLVERSRDEIVGLL